MSLSTREIAEELRAAAERIKAFGWQQGVFGNEREGFCAMGALGCVARMGQYNGPTAQALVRVLGLVGEGSIGQRVAQWNNRPRQTREGVLLGLEFTALYLEEEEKVRVEALWVAETKQAGGEEVRVELCSV